VLNDFRNYLTADRKICCLDRIKVSRQYKNVGLKIENCIGFHQTISAKADESKNVKVLYFALEIGQDRFRCFCLCWFYPFQWGVNWNAFGYFWPFFVFGSLLKNKRNFKKPETYVSYFTRNLQLLKHLFQ